MIPETHIEGRPNPDTRNHDLARRILGIGFLAVVLCSALALLRRRKAIFLRPLMAFVFIVLALALLGSFMKALRSRCFDRS
jgi:membrane protein CcdC involved in cytochrome C biogenesis